MGIQAQVALDTSLTNPRNFINKITDLGLEVEITEPDALFRMFNSCEDPYATQAEYYSGMLKICFENPLCKELIFWGFSDDLCWMDQMGFFSQNQTNHTGLILI